MNSSIECLVRGSHKIFVLLRVTDIPDAAAITLRSTTDADASAPAMLFPFEDGGAPDADAGASRRFVAVVAQLAVAQTLTLVAASDATRASASHRITPAMAKWSSRLNYRTRASLAARIRDYDRYRMPHRLALFAEESYGELDEEILRGTVCCDPAFTVPMTVEMLDDRAEPVETTFTVMGDRVAGDHDRPELRYRCLVYSLRHAKCEAPLILQARTAEGPLPGFLVIDQPKLDEIRGNAFYAAITASWDAAYDQWFAGHRLLPSDFETQRSTRFPYEPLFSLVVPLYRTPIAFLCEMVESVVAQTYRHWELILVNASPEDAELSRTIAEFAALTDAIRIVDLPSNGGISANTNAGIAAARGDFIALLDHDDLIEPDLLHEYARALNDDDAIDCIYCDEDKLRPDGSLIEPFFKPDFEIDLLRNKNYVCHLLAIRATLLQRIGGLRSLYDGAQDHDLSLRAFEHGAHFHHVRRVLYHWRMAAASTSRENSIKPYTKDAGLRAIQDHLDRLHLDATAESFDAIQAYKVKYAPPTPHPLVSIIIPSKDSIDYLDRCLTSIAAKTSYDAYEIVIVENRSTEAATFDYYRRAQERDGRLRIVTWEDDGLGFNFSKLINFGVTQARGDYLLLLNNDVEVLTPDWLDRLVGFCKRDDVGAVGAKLYYPDGTIQHAGVAMLCWIGPKHLMKNVPRKAGGYFALDNLTQDLSCVTGACLMTTRACYDAVGGFDEAFAVDFNDVDFCLKLRRAGLLVVFTPDVELYHYESVSRGLNDSPTALLRSYRELTLLKDRWPHYFCFGDPYYNIQLDNDRAYYHLKW